MQWVLEMEYIDSYNGIAVRVSLQTWLEDFLKIVTVMRFVPYRYVSDEM